MKNMLYILAITPILVGCGSNAEPVNVEDATAFVATVYTFAVLTPDDEKIDDRTPNPRPEPNECECNGTGYQIHGDGHRTPCVCQPGCRCSSSGMAPTSSEEPEAVSEPSGASDEGVTESPKPKVRLMVFSASWCAPCQQLKSELASMKAAGWDIGESESDTVQVIDFDTNGSLAQSLGVTGLPTVIRMVDGEPTEAHKGFMDSFALRRFLDGGE